MPESGSNAVKEVPLRIDINLVFILVFSCIHPFFLFWRKYIFVFLSLILSLVLICRFITLNHSQGVPHLEASMSRGGLG
jgi:hypothetical protein